MGAASRSAEVGGKPTVQVLPSEQDRLVNEKAWMINITTPVTSNSRTTVAESVDQIVSLIQGSYGVTDSKGKSVLSTEAEILDRDDNLVIDGRHASRVYLRVPTSKDVKIVKGYTVFSPKPRQFVILELITPAEAFPFARKTYELMVGTVRFQDTTAVGAEREAVLTAGAAFLRGLSPDDFASVFNSQDTWQRLYVPSKSGADADATELGYRGLRFWRGKRGEISPEIPRTRWTDEDNHEGVIARIAVRLLEPATNGGSVASQSDFYDSVGLYFLSTDRNEEAWTVRMVHRGPDGRELSNWTETGARLGHDLGVTIKQTGAPSVPATFSYNSDAYLSQPESFVAPALIVKQAIKLGLERSELAFYSYRTESHSLPMRRDVLTKDAARGGVWSLSTRFRDEGPAQVSLFSSRGEFLRTELTEGRVWEPVDIDTLFKLWKQKGLPTDTAAPKPAPKGRK